MYGSMADLGVNIMKRLAKWMDWDVTIVVVHTTNNIVNSIKLNQEMVEKLMLSHVVKDILELYISMSKGMVPKVVQKNIKAVYLTHDKENY